jgi:hypothetical protein
MRATTWLASALAVVLWCRLWATQGQLALVAATLGELLGVSDVLSAADCDIDTVAATSEALARASAPFLIERRKKR